MTDDTDKKDDLVRHESQFTQDLDRGSVIATGNNFDIEYHAEGGFTMRIEGNTRIYTPLRDDATVNVSEALCYALEDIPEIKAMLDLAALKIKEQQDHIDKLETMAMTDELTGLYNRHGFAENFDREAARIERGTSEGCVLLLLDLDKFKPINDTYGHQAGDACLKLVANTLMAEARATDTVARFGGDEFAVLLTDTIIEKAQDKIHRIRESLNSLAVNWEGATIPIGCSLGGAEYHTREEYEGLYKAADEALYADKEMRRKWMNLDVDDRSTSYAPPTNKPPKAKS